ncbi:aminopeptidase [Calorimonas adulescens]|jgi:Aminopeptidase I zinc metalloprotease (M18).|uniref:M18 family aminopeptidase n=1 Tax=Calorimonas adulescens TaxID=2606906 RepID=A0A5D8QCA0_9THEO|nr:aminopeptidase [Calorimonas adulescens]TZE82270.1 aminopeptidase [Calorimonas adulescens]
MEESKKLKDELMLKDSTVWERVDEAEKEQIYDYCEGYKYFLNNCKTERESTQFIISQAIKNGFISLDEAIDRNLRLIPGSKVYVNNKDKSVILAVIGNTLIEKGMNIVAAHIDAPRIDLKPTPVYEEGGLALFNTHYYGGIKKYQWVAIPLAMHGVVIKNDGQKVNISIGENENDPVLYISDLLPHLSKDQMEKKAAEVITGEGLDVLVGSIPYPDKETEQRVKLNILKMLKEKYGIMEEDLISAEIEIVPALKVRDIGLDRSMIGGYGQDDRVSAYTALTAILSVENPMHTCLAVFADKEEVGSMGNTGLQSHFMENTVAELLVLTGNTGEIYVRRALANSKLLSADVNVAYDPLYADAYDKTNTPFLGKGVVLTKYTGSRGKSGSNDANAEFVGAIRAIFNSSGVVWQAGELGKVDVGGGGTIAQFVASYGMEVVDCGVALLSMHSPYELSSKADVYMAHKAYSAFYHNA